MNQLQRLPSPRRLSIFLTCSLVAIAAAILAGCDSDPPADGGANVPVPAKPAMPIDSILDSLQPDRYGISVPVELPTTYLNNWGKENLEKLLSDDVDEAALKEKLSPLLSDEQIERVLRREFIVRDSVHLRDMMWARQLMAATQVDGESDLAQVTRLFYHVAITVRLLGDSEVPLPLSPFDTVLYGRGTAADRVWVFSCLARQLRLPVLLAEFEHGTKSEGDSRSTRKPPFIAGVMIDGSLYLFDFQLGLPIPSASCPPGDALPGLPATLKEALENDSILRSLDVGEELPYGATADQLKKARLLIVGDSSVWARRVEAVQYAISGSSVPTVFEPLVAYGSFKDGGFYEIACEGLKGLVPGDAIGIWDYPEAQRTARENMTTEQTEELNRIHAPMKAPRAYHTEGDGGNGQAIVYGSGRQLQLKARVDQVLGRPGEAIPIYLKIQAWRNSTPKADPKLFIPPHLEQKAQQLPEDILALHARAALEAMYWQATCQLQLGKLSAAVTDFSRWIATERAPELIGQAALLNGISYARQGKFLSATGFLNRIPQEDVLYQTARILLQRWKAIEAEG